MPVHHPRRHAGRDRRGDPEGAPQIGAPQNNAEEVNAAVAAYWEAQVAEAEAGSGERAVAPEAMAPVLKVLLQRARDFRVLDPPAGPAAGPGQAAPEDFAYILAMEASGRGHDGLGPDCSFSFTGLFLLADGRFAAVIQEVIADPPRGPVYTSIGAIGSTLPAVLTTFQGDVQDEHTPPWQLRNGRLVLAVDAFGCPVGARGRIPLAEAISDAEESEEFEREFRRALIRVPELASGRPLRTARDGLAYTYNEFRRHYTARGGASRSNQDRLVRQRWQEATPAPATTKPDVQAEDRLAQRLIRAMLEFQAGELPSPAPTQAAAASDNASDQ